MIEVLYWPTPNGHKITIMLEETGQPYKITPVNIGEGEQFEPSFLALSPNNKMPAVVDHRPADGGEPLSLFESGAILQYLAEKTGQLLAADVRHKFATLPWLFWQMAHLGPMLGQLHHFASYAPEKIDYAIDRYRKETERLYGIMDDRLAEADFLAGNYTIADIASYPWVLPDQQDMDMGEFPNLERWRRRIGERPAVQRAYRIGDDFQEYKLDLEKSGKILFGQGRRKKI